MALIGCVECGGKVSDQAVACPHCGYPAKRAITACGSGALLPVAKVPVPKASSLPGPWKPQLLIPIAIAMGIFGTPLGLLWIGLVTAWNWWRCGHAERIYWPVIVAILGAVPVWLGIAGLIESVSGMFTAYGLAILAAGIMCYDLWLQLPAIRQYEASGQQLGSHWLPCGVAVLIVAVAVLVYLLLGIGAD